MKRKSSGAAVIAVLVGVVVAVTLYIASFGKSSHHADIPAATGETVATQSPASDASFAASTPEAMTAAR
ncbi:hypothetical protein [Caballeronia sp. Lep1P3]|uniref:hypothetical protein n=1 Tax=Caballeronia sp. Lep1P3 TaxID=2878150 RepID=UPI001FD3617D|nr:hypothetical protein [Caballeronia sp. Lep1P3]